MLPCQLMWSSGLLWGVSWVLFVSPRSADDAIGEVAYVDSAAFASDPALGGFSGEVGGAGLPAGLDDRRDVQHRVDAPVASEVEPALGGVATAFAWGQGDGAGAAPAGELGLAVEPSGVAYLAEQHGGGDRADAGLVARCGAVLVEQIVDEPFEAAARCAVLVDECPELSQAVSAGGGWAGSGVDVFEAAQPGFDLADCGELVADLGEHLGDLVRDVVQHQCSSSHKGATALEHGLDLRDEGVIDLQRLDRAEATASVLPICREWCYAAEHDANTSRVSNPAAANAVATWPPPFR